VNPIPPTSLRPRRALAASALAALFVTFPAACPARDILWASHATVNDSDTSYSLDNQSSLEGTTNRPNGELRLSVKGNSRVRISGIVETLVIEGIDNQSVVDLTELRTSKIVMLGKLQGQSILRVTSTGDAAFHDQIYGLSTLDLKAANVQFWSEIDGQSTVLIDSHGRIDGPELRGDSHVRYKKYADGPTVTFKKIAENATAIPL
jgi:hypothetical protein